MKRLIFTILLLLFALEAHSQQAVLHDFKGFSMPNGAFPLYTDLISDGTKFYGMTVEGGQTGEYNNSYGVVFSINHNGTGYTILHDFLGEDAGDGRNPTGSLILSGSTLFGMTLLGGSDDEGVIFSIETDGTNYTLLHEFTGGNNDGSRPYGNLILDGTTLYGMTDDGGDNYEGVIFSIETNGSSFTLLHEFDSWVNDGRFPFANSLTLNNGVLYGMTESGGANYDGVIFSIETDGSNYTLLYEFSGGVNDGDRPIGSLIVSGSTLFGMTIWGGDNDNGVIFSIETDGSGFTLLHEFSGGQSDGQFPFSHLTLNGSTLYGMTEEGGDNDNGVIFSIETDGSGFTLLHEFDGEHGKYPYGGLNLIGSLMYGMTYAGGKDDVGTIFRIENNGNNFTLLHEFDGDINPTFPYFTNLVYDGSKFYGQTVEGGSNFYGTIFSVDPTGENFTVIHAFGGGENDGASPYGSLLVSGDKLYGMTAEGGDYDQGTIFRINKDGSDFSLLHEFSAEEDDGGYPGGSLIQSGSTLYGMTSQGGDDDAGVIFSIGLGGNDFTILHEFKAGFNDGGYPAGSLILDGTTLYGMTDEGGASLDGVIFSIKTDGSSYTLLHEFTRSVDDGGNTYGDLTLYGSTLYGMTLFGGDDDEGVIFSIETDGSGFNLLHEFERSANDGGVPLGSLILSSTNLYGMTMHGGDDDFGTIFRIDIDGTNYKVLHEFTGWDTDGAEPAGSLYQIGPVLYGLTSYGGEFDAGTVFGFTLGIPTVVTKNVTDLSLSSATCGGFISDEGDYPVTASGIVYSTTSNPVVGGENVINVPTSPTVTSGEFVSLLSSLVPETRYYVRAYATNADGTAYGVERTFLFTPIPTLPEWGLIIFGGLIAFYGIWRIYKS